MIARELTSNISALVSIDWDRRLFDELVPLPEGTTYNAYLVQGSEKTALIDTTYAPFIDDLLAVLKRNGIERLDYIVSNHAEQDHSSAIPALLKIYPEAMVVANVKTRNLIVESLGVSADKFIEAKDGETLSLGNLTLEFLLMPWVHWPDTMATYVRESQIIFTCDFFGSHLASSDLFATEESRVEDAAKRYYAEIMMPFRVHVKKHLERLKSYQIAMIAPSHGPVFDRPEFILDLYRQWASDVARPDVVIPYVSMYDSTTQMVKYLVDRLIERGMRVQPFNVVDGDTGELAKHLVEASTVIFASPVVLAGPHPDIAHAAYLANALKPKTKLVGIIGSYGWGGNVLTKSLLDMLPALKSQVEVLDPVLTKGQPEERDFHALDDLADVITSRNELVTDIVDAR